MQYNYKMQYVIDGHNLIPQVRGLTLSDIDDEESLIDVLVPFLRARKSRAMVFFDRAGLGQAGQRNYGLVKAFFVAAPVTADDAIADYFRQLGGSARNLTLVSSDRMVQAAARAAHASVLSSQEFSSQLKSYYAQSPAESPQERELSPEEIKQWEELFNQYGSMPPDGMSP